MSQPDRTAASQGNVEPVCSPLCGAEKAYGSRVKWWQHERLCPVRQAAQVYFYDPDEEAAK